MSFAITHIVKMQKSKLYDRNKESYQYLFEFAIPSAFEVRKFGTDWSNMKRYSVQLGAPSAPNGDEIADWSYWSHVGPYR